MAVKEFKQVFVCKETKCTITSDNKGAIETAISSIVSHRKQLERYIQSNPKFLYSFRPIPVSNGPMIAKLMAEAAEKACVGPMAAVAGVLADLAVKDMVLDGAEVAVVENGGEISAVSNRPVSVALLAGDCQLSKSIGFMLEDFPIGVATSSGLFSHAISLGEAEAVTVFAENAGLADASATAVGNVVKGENFRKAVELGIREGLSIEGVDGVFIIYRDRVGKAGRIPEIIRVDD